MSKLQELIQRLCPDGVEYKKLGDVCEVVNAPKKLYKKDYQDIGLYPIIDQGKSMIVGYTNNTDVLLPAKEYVLFGDHTRNVKFYNGTFAQGADGLKILISKDIVLPRFLYYSMQCLIIEDRGYNRHWTVVSPLPVPVPPLEVQEEIVKILDRFAVYAAELQAELQARKEQYEYYRNLLLTFNPTGCAGGADDEQEGSVTTWGGHSYPIHWKTMGEICKKTKNIKWKDNLTRECLYIDLSSVDCESHSFSNQLTTINAETAPSRAQQIVETNDVLFGTTRPTLMRFAIVPQNLNGHICSTGYAVLRANYEIVLPQFLYFTLNTHRFYSFVENNQEGAGYPSISFSRLQCFPIPVPPLELQEKIVAVLDRFETLVNDLSEGLPAEIAAVKEQYEYYRNKLLTFKEKSA